MKRFTRECLFCGGPATVLAPEGSDELDVDAEFSSAGRAFGDDNEMVGVGCYRCAVKQWLKEDRAAPVPSSSKQPAQHRGGRGIA